VSSISWKWVWMTALIAAAVASYGVLNRSPDGALVPDERMEQPGYYLRNAVLTVTQPDGSERMRLVADRIDEQVVDRSYAATGVRVDYTVSNDKPWTLRADAAHVPADLKIVVFSGNVTVSSEQGPRMGIIRTETLTLDTEANRASTPASVAIEFAGQQLHATGLEADLSSQRLKLESGVNGRFQQN